jgi:serine/threonine-protein kinase
MTQVPRVERADPFIGQTLEGRFHVVDRLGAGGMSQVYRAQQIAGGPDVAVKVLNNELIHDKSQRERFEREARALFALEHPNILRVYDYGVVNGLPFLVMELLQGQTLDTLVEQGPLAPEDAVAVVTQILTGLAHAHGQGVLHRDIKTENVYVALDPSGRRTAKLLDFGLVKFVDDDRWGAGKALTAFGEVFGTPAYMSPEQCTGAPVDAASDVYSVGVVLFELLTGQWPFMMESRAEMMRAHLMTPPATLAQTRPGMIVRPELETLVATALAKDKAARYPDARAMLAALSAIPHPVAHIPGVTPSMLVPGRPQSIPGYSSGDATDPLLAMPQKRSLAPLIIVGSAVALGLAIVGGALLYLLLR